MKKIKGKAQPKGIYLGWINLGIAFLLILSTGFIIFGFNDTSIFWICFSVFITVAPFILAIKNYETFYVTETEIVVKNPFKKLNIIKKQDITNIYVERFVVGPTYLGSYWQYIVIATNDNKVNQWNYLNGKKDYILIDFSCKNEEIINEWTENKFDLYE